MAVTTPSARNTVWAEHGTRTQPSDGAIDSGFAAAPAKPGRQTTNWLLWWLDNAVQYILAWIAAFTTTVNAAIDSRLGTLSAVVTTGIAADNGTVTQAHTMNFPNTTHKILAFQLDVSLANSPATVTLSGDAAFSHGIRTVQLTSNGASVSALAVSTATFQIDVSANAQVQVLVTGY